MATVTSPGDREDEDLVDYYGNQFTSDDEIEEISDEDDDGTGTKKSTRGKKRRTADKKDSDVETISSRDDDEEDPSYEPSGDEAKKGTKKQKHKKKHKKHKKEHKKSKGDKPPVTLKLKQDATIIPRSRFLRVGPSRPDKVIYPTGPKGVKTIFCEICRINVYYVNPGGWYQHFQKKHGGKINSNEIAEDEESEDSPEVLILDEKVKEAPELINLEPFDDSAQRPPVTQTRLGQPSRSKCPKCHKWLAGATKDQHECSGQIDLKFDHVCDFLKKQIQFASQEGLVRHMAKYHGEDATGEQMEVSLQDDGSYQFFKPSDNITDADSITDPDSITDAEDVEKSITEQLYESDDEPKIRPKIKIIKSRRGRPPKERHPFGELITKRPVGRPRKLFVNELKVIRPRGRPRKERNPVDEPKAKRPRGRPRKEQIMGDELKVRQPPGRPRKIRSPNDEPKQRLRGRPRKALIKSREMSVLSKASEVGHVAKTTHRCKVLQKQIHFASQKAVDNHMRVCHYDDDITEREDMDVFVRNDGSYQFLSAHGDEMEAAGKIPKRGKPFGKKKKISPDDDLSGRKRKLAKLKSKKLKKKGSKSFGKPKGFQNLGRPRTGGFSQTCVLCHRHFTDQYRFNRHKSLCIRACMRRVCKTCNVLFMNFSSYTIHVCNSLSKIHTESECFKVCIACGEKFHSVQLAILHASICNAAKNGKEDKGLDSDTDIAAEPSCSEQVLACKVEVVEEEEEEPTFKMSKVLSSCVDVMLRPKISGGENGAENGGVMLGSQNSGGENGGGGGIIGNGDFISMYKDKINNPDYRVHWLLRDPSFPNPLGLTI